MVSMQNRVFVGHLPAVLEPNGLIRDDGKRPDGMTFVPWEMGRPLIWDATSIVILSANYVTTIVSRNVYGNRGKRAHFDNFNVLLNLYKMNPLKKSEIYQSFTNRVLPSNRDESAFNTSVHKEKSVETTLSVNQLKNIINVKTPYSEINQANFDIENINTEKFSVNTLNETVKESSRWKDDFNTILRQLESVEANHIPVTKMLPVNNTNSLALLNTNEIVEPSRKINVIQNEVFNTVNDIVSEANLYPNDGGGKVMSGKVNYFSDASVVILR